MTWAVVPAAGRGTRFGGGVPKQYLDVAGEPVLAHTLRALLAHASVEGVVVALAADRGQLAFEAADDRDGRVAVEVVDVHVGLRLTEGGGMEGAHIR